MKKHGWILLALVPISHGCEREQNATPDVNLVKAQTATVPKVAASKSTKPDQNTLHNKWVAKCLREMESVKIGMTRADVLRVFTTEGGVSAPGSRQYVHRECLLFKVAVEFAVTREQNRRVLEKPTDKITKISPPFLQWSIAD